LGINVFITGLYLLSIPKRCRLLQKQILALWQRK